MKLMVIGKDFDSSRERELYTKALDGCLVDWEFRPRNSLLDSYHSLDLARIAVSTSSSLGYEALGRGIRSAFFMLDPEVTGHWGDKFGWPLIEEDDGPIWTNYLDRERTIGTLWYLHNLSDEEWSKVRTDYMPRLIAKDPGNTTLESVIAQCMEHHDGASR
jgi:surface carbohydrate biosynthesis protein